MFSKKGTLKVEKRDVKPLIVPEYTLSDSSEASCVLDAQGHCITCSDEALPARVLRIDYGTGMALVEVGAGAREEVDITLVDEIEPGDWLLVHGGAAIGNLDGPSPGEVGNE